jgi:hypothetical protein
MRGGPWATAPVRSRQPHQQPDDHDQCHRDAGLGRRRGTGQCHRRLAWRRLGPVGGAWGGHLRCLGRAPRPLCGSVSKGPNTNASRRAETLKVAGSDCPSIAWLWAASRCWSLAWTASLLVSPTWCLPLYAQIEGPGRSPARALERDPGPPLNSVICPCPPQRLGRWLRRTSRLAA